MASSRTRTPMGQTDRRMKSALISASCTSSLVALSGAAGFRLRPDSETYASGALLPNSLAAGIVGSAGGMVALVTVSALAAGIVVGLLPDNRSRCIFALLGGFWFLFPGADALGILGVALMLRASSRGFLWFLTGAFHAVAAVVTLPLALRSRYALLWSLIIGFCIMIGFSTVETGPVSWWEHFLYTSRYLIPASYLYLYTVRRQSAKLHS